MSDQEILEEKDDLRLILIPDIYPDEPYNLSASPLLQLDIGYGTSRAEHVAVGDRPASDDSRIEEAAIRWGSDFAKLEKYLRAFHGATKVEKRHSGNYWYVSYDSAAWRAWSGAPEGSASMAEYRAWCEGDVWTWAIEQREMQTWEERESCGGFYGYDYAQEAAREAFKAYLGR